MEVDELRYPLYELSDANIKNCGWQFTVVSLFGVSIQLMELCQTANLQSLEKIKPTFTDTGNIPLGVL